MKKLLRTVLIFLILTLPITALSQTNCITPNWGESIVAFEEDSTFLWIATNDSGLIRFNKQTEEKTYYNTTNSNISSNKILSLLYYNNELIVSTDSNLLRFTDNSFTTINDTTKGMMIEDFKGNLVVVERESYSYGAIYTFHNDNIIQKIDICDSVQKQCLDNNDITIDSSGNIWLVRSEFYAFDVGNFNGTTYQSFSAQGFPIDAFNPSITSNGNLIIMSNYKGIFSYNGAWQFTIPHEQIIDGNDTLNQSLSSIELESNGNLWAGTDSGIFANQPGRIIYLNNGVWKFLPQTDSLPSSITTFHLSKFESNIVYAGSTNGFMIIDKSCLGLTSTISESTDEISLLIFPNPSKEVINVRLSGNLRIENSILLDINGKKLKQFGNDSELSIFDVPKGLYFLQVNTNKGVMTKKITIE